MSSDGSASTTGSRLRQFGLYRTIDERTEEFLRLSRKRQIRQGCACAAISTAVTVIVVIIVLLICEHMIVVETNLVQNKRNFNISKRLHDVPIADKLDRIDFGFDQDYFERMPLLLNALQDNTYMEPTVETFVIPRNKHTKIHVVRPSSIPRKTIRRTSPRPFVYEYRSPYPRPFLKADSKTNSWVENYRNAQRLKNLHDVVKYLETTLNAKFGDTYLPSKTQIAFSSVYVAPIEKYFNLGESVAKPRGPKFDPSWNHQNDPLLSYKPDRPDDVNLLMDDQRVTFVPRTHKIPNMSPNIEFANNCRDAECSRREIHFNNKKDVKNSIDPNNIYITTLKPLVQFRRKTLPPTRKYLFQNKRQKILKNDNDIKNPTITKDRTTSEPKVVLQLNVYSLNVEDRSDANNRSNINNSKPEDYPDTTPTLDIQFPKTTVDTVYNQFPEIENTHNFEFQATSVEDYHVGSSGIIPINIQTQSPPTYPITTPIVPAFISTVPIIESSSVNPLEIFTNAPEILKFSPEDAKIPDQYLSWRKSDVTEITSTDNKYGNNVEIETEEIPNTIIAKLRNFIQTTTQEYKSETETMEEDIEEVTQTYVPQINGHYRNIKYKNLSALLKENSERYKKRLEILTVTKKPTYGPTYTEIKRNHTDLMNNT